MNVLLTTTMAGDKMRSFVNGGNGAPVGTPAEEEACARDLARRYRCEFLDLRNHHIQHEDLLCRIHCATAPCR